MNRETIEKKVNTLMHEGFEIPYDKLIPTATLFEDLGLDSLDAVDMLVYLEEKLGIKVEGEKIMHVRTLNDVYEMVSDVVSGIDLKSEKLQAIDSESDLEINSQLGS